MSKKQKTLFESWNQCSSKSISTNQGTSKKNETRSLLSNDLVDSPSHNAFQTNNFARTARSQLVDNGFDSEAGKTWIYPTNYPIRDYQFSIVQEGLFKNTLVILPTGLGKTFIAAVVMYNIYRWYPKGKVVFMAPTRPLVAQQIDACYKVTGISPEDTTQMTGTNMPEERKRMWEKKRVFFLTPQVFVNDLVRSICTADSIKCVVVDEAHKALGNHAYCQVIRELQAYTNQFRILALTATPGSDNQAVKMVLSNLLISHVEMRSEDSDDVKQYTHTRDIEKIVVPLGDRLLSIKSRFLDVINIYLKRLTQRRAMTSKNPSSLSKYQILKIREEFSQHPPNNINKFDYGLALADFSMCISLYHAYELLMLHGARPFYNFLKGILNGDKSIPHARAELMKNIDFEELFKEVEENYVTESVLNCPNTKMGANGTRVLPGHPKLEKLLEIVLQHFRAANNDSVTSTRVMIFSQYRDSVDEIVEMLNHHQPMIKVMSFIGQASRSATSVGYSQKHQLKVIQEFRNGGYNTLVSTCVGEEGLDIGEVDLIVCYDCPKSPIRLVQRMGRTGRLRKGKIVILVTEGKEVQMYNSCEGKKKAIYRAISKGSAFAELYRNSPSMIPNGKMKPVCVKTIVSVEPPKPFFKLKGKIQESAFLSEDELREFNNNFKVPKSETPLLAQSSFVSFKSEEQIQIEPSNRFAPPNENLLLVKPRLSLSKWMLWQTTPQRTHLVSHSSKSLLLIETSEKINFPDAINRPSIQQGALETTIPPTSNEKLADSNSLLTNNSNPPVIDLCSDDDLCDFGELEDIENETIALLNGDQCMYNLKPNIDTSVNENSKIFLSKKLSTSIPFISRIPEGNLFKKLFGFDSIKLPHNENNCILKPPPSISNIISLESINGLLFEPDPLVEHKTCTLRILNNKMRARITRKSKELGIKLSFTFDNEKLDSSIKENITFNSLIAMHVNENIPDVDASVQFFSPVANRKPKLDASQPLLPKGIAFDLDFDIPQVLEKFSDEVDDNLLPSSSCCKSNCDPVANDKKQQEESCNIDADSSLIFEQFFSNKDDDIADKLEASFCSPLMIKKIVFERDSLSTQEGQKEVPVPKNKCFKVNKDGSIKRELNESKITEPTQYSLTQLVSLIDNAGHTDNNMNKNKHKNIAVTDFTCSKSDENSSSDEEIEPTPPKEIVPVATKFCYRINSANFDSDVPQKESEQPKSPVPLNSKISFDLSFTPTITGYKVDTKNLENMFPSKVNPHFKGRCNSVSRVVKDTKPVNLPTSISFDLSDIHCSPKGISEHPHIIMTKLEKCNETNSCNETSLINGSKQAITTNPDNRNSRISFDLSDEQFSPFKKAKDNAGIHFEHEESYNIINSVEDSEPNVLNCRITSSQSKFDTSISFDLSDLQFSPTEKLPTKETHQNSSKRIVCADPTNINTNVSFNLSDTEFSQCSESERNTTAFTRFEKQNKLTTFSEKANQTPNKRITDNSKMSNTYASFDLFEVQLSPDKKVSNKVSDSKIETVNENDPISTQIEKFDQNTSFESPTLDKVFFDISFDFPELNTDPLLKDDKSIENKVNVVPKKVNLVHLEPLNSTLHNNSISIAQTSLQTHTGDVDPANKSILPRKSKDVSAVQPCTSYSQYKDVESTKLRDDIIPQKSNQNMVTSRKLGLKRVSGIEANLKTLEQSPESPKIFGVGKKKRPNVLNDTTLTSPSLHSDELDDFVQPVSKTNTAETISRSKKSKQKTKNKFLLSQAVVSGSESSGDEMDEYEDAMDASFINDNTVVESPLNQRAMYLQSVKNIVGLPQRFKLKEKSNYNDQIYSQPIEEGCSYLLDSFCVDDDEVIFTNSSEEIEENIKDFFSKSKKKRKRIVALSDSSSSEEEYVKKIKSSEEDLFVRKLTPESNSFTIAGGSKVSKKMDSISPIRHVGKHKVGTNNFSKINNKLSIAPCLKITNQCQTSNILPEGIKDDFQDVKSHLSLEIERNAKSSSKYDYKNAISDISKQNEDLLNFEPHENFAFDVGWDDIDPVPQFQSMNKHVTSNPSKLKNTTCVPEVHSNAVASTMTPSYVNQSQATKTNENVTIDVGSAVDRNRKCSTQVISCLNTSSSLPNIPPVLKTILVDSRELASGKPVISCLRNKHGVNTFVMQLVSADYILSNKVAVERIVDSDFPSFGLPIKLVEKVRAMSELYEKPFVIIEKDSRKRSMGFNKLSTKYLQFAVCANFHPTVNILYSNSVEDTASIIYDIIKKEQKKGLQIDVPVALNPSSQKLYDFYLSFPHASPICALNFVYNFPSVNLVFKSTVEQLKKAGFISSRKANAMFNYIRSELLLNSFP